ncbi:hypothetical protein GFY24_38220 [Nocardia sp. SYP-A9097]|uniref:hypothetical protein n=1 Tax=Nocardia sp. SYP-A9097 TaxID=2663237 RepID=UPI00129A212C|nr:hypothetical protein [Nocardia sp. SYP-A9097]MRH93190.1 hypothetical protein [Nocardia sp. SYP-A9097]
MAETLQALDQLVDGVVSAAQQDVELVGDSDRTITDVVLRKLAGDAFQVGFELLEFRGSVVPGVAEREQRILITLRVRHPEVEGRHQPTGKKIPAAGTPSHGSRALVS